MKKLRKEIVRNVRLDKPFDDLIIAIAEHEDRFVSQVLRRLLRDGAQNYIDKNPDFSISTKDSLFV